MKAKQRVKILGQTVIVGSKKHQNLLYIVKHHNDLMSKETN